MQYQDVINRILEDSDKKEIDPEYLIEVIRDFADLDMDPEFIAEFIRLHLKD